MKKNYGKTSINPPLAGISLGALNQFTGNAFLEELKRTAISATPTTLEEVANGVVHPVLSVWGQLIIFFHVFIFCAYFGMLLKGMGESFILSEDEPLTPNIDGVVAL